MWLGWPAKRVPQVTSAVTTATTTAAASSSGPYAMAGARVLQYPRRAGSRAVCSDACGRRPPPPERGARPEDRGGESGRSFGLDPRTGRSETAREKDPGTRGPEGVVAWRW